MIDFFSKNCNYYYFFKHNFIVLMPKCGTMLIQKDQKIPKSN